MPATEAQIRANQQNAQKSTGPKTPEGKEASRANSLKHGMTGFHVLPEVEAVEVARRTYAFAEDLKPTGDVGVALTRLAAIMSVRIERCFEYENATLTERVRRAEANFVPPEGADEATIALLRTEAGKRALFDSSPEATLARRYEAAAQRGFFKALKELRIHEKAMKATEEDMVEEHLASFRHAEMTDEEFERLYAEATANRPAPPVERPEMDPFDVLRGRVDVPFSIGKLR
jgi:hypothetical protein